MEEENWDFLLGGLSQPPKPTNLEELIKEMLSEPLEDDNVSWSICSNCGMYSPINLWVAEKQLEIIEMLEGDIPSAPVNFSDYYFITTYCECCRYFKIPALNIEIIPI